MRESRHAGQRTARQVERLEQFLDKWQWRPKEVKLFFFGMSGSFSAGNDFVDNYNYGRWLKCASRVESIRRRAAARQPQAGGRSGSIGWQEPLLEHSTLVATGEIPLGAAAARA